MQQLQEKLHQQSKKFQLKERKKVQQLMMKVEEQQLL
jgi:hypothetical protein